MVPLCHKIATECKEFHKAFEPEILNTVASDNKTELDFYGTKYRKERQLADVIKQEKEVDFKLYQKKRKRTKLTALEDSLLFEPADDPKYLDVRSKVDELKASISDLREQQNKLKRERQKLENFREYLNQRVMEFNEQYKEHQKELEAKSVSHINAVLTDQKAKVQAEARKYYQTQHQVEYQKVQQFFGDELVRKENGIQHYWKNKFLVEVQR